MREKIIKALTESRALVRGQIELHSCIHAGHYWDGNRSCRLCEYDFECKWLYQNDEFVALAHKTTAALIESLEFAEAYVDAIITRGGHDRRACRCESCKWLRRIRRLSREIGCANDSG